MKTSITRLIDMERYLIFRLGDNDFGRLIENAVEDLLLEKGLDFCPFIAKEYVIEHVYKQIEDEDKPWSTIDSVKEYLSKSMRVYRTDKFPSYDLEGKQLVDDDWGSVYVDIPNAVVKCF